MNLDKLFEDYNKVSGISREIFDNSYANLGDEYLTLVQDQLKKKDESQLTQESLSIGVSDTNTELLQNGNEPLPTPIQRPDIQPILSEGQEIIAPPIVSDFELPNSSSDWNTANPQVSSSELDGSNAINAIPQGVVLPSNPNNFYYAGDYSTSPKQSISNSTKRKVSLGFSNEGLGTDLTGNIDTYNENQEVKINGIKIEKEFLPTKDKVVENTPETIDINRIKTPEYSINTRFAWDEDLQFANGQKATKEELQKSLDDDEKNGILKKLIVDGKPFKNEFGSYVYEPNGEEGLKILNDRREKRNQKLEELVADHNYVANKKLAEQGDAPQTNLSQFTNEYYSKTGKLLTNDEIENADTYEKQRTLLAKGITEKQLKENPRQDYQALFNRNLDKELPTFSDNDMVHNGTWVLDNLQKGVLVRSANRHSRDQNFDINNLPSDSSFLNNDDKNEFALFGRLKQGDDFKKLAGEYWMAKGRHIYDTKAEQNFVFGTAEGSAGLINEITNYHKNKYLLNNEVIQNRVESKKQQLVKLAKEGKVNEVAQLKQSIAQDYNQSQGQQNVLKSFDVISDTIGTHQKEYQSIIKKRTEDVAAYQNGEILGSLKVIGGNILNSVGDSVKGTVAGVLRLGSGVNEVFNMGINTLTGKDELQTDNKEFNASISQFSKPVQIGGIVTDGIFSKYEEYRLGDKTIEKRNGVFVEVDKNGNYKPIYLNNAQQRDLQFVKQKEEFSIAGIVGSSAGMMMDMYGANLVGKGVARVGTFFKDVAQIKNASSVLGAEHPMTKFMKNGYRLMQSPNNYGVSGWFINTFDDNYKYAVENGASNGKALFYAMVQSAGTGLLSKVNPDFKFFNTVKSVDEKLLQSILNKNTNGIIENIKAFPSNYSKHISKEVANEIGQETSEYVFQGLANAVSEGKLTTDKLETFSYEGFKEMLITTAIATSALTFTNRLMNGRQKDIAEYNNKFYDIRGLSDGAKKVLLSRLNTDELFKDFKKSYINDSKAIDKTEYEVKEIRRQLEKVPESEKYSLQALTQVAPELQALEKLREKVKTIDPMFVNDINEQIAYKEQRIKNILEEDLQQDNAQETKNQESPTPTQPKQEAVQGEKSQEPRAENQDEGKVAGEQGAEGGVGNIVDNKNNDNFVQDENTSTTTIQSETQLDNGGTMESSSQRPMVGRRSGSSEIYRTAEAANTAGSRADVITGEDREELESRGINPDWDFQKFRNVLEEQAKQNNVWLGEYYLSDKKLVHDHKQQGTNENDVYINPDGKTFTKVNNLYPVRSGEHHQNMSAFLDRINAHNILFPNVPYDIKGFTKNKDGRTSIVMEQSIIDFERNATKQEIEYYLKNRGFELSGTRDWSNGHKVWSNGKYELFDARPANVLMGKDGQLYFIDTIPHSVEYMNKKHKFADNETRRQLHEETDQRFQRGEINESQFAVLKRQNVQQGTQPVDSRSGNSQSEKSSTSREVNLNPTTTSENNNLEQESVQGENVVPNTQNQQQNETQNQNIEQPIDTNTSQQSIDKANENTSDKQTSKNEIAKTEEVDDYENLDDEIISEIQSNLDDIVDDEITTNPLNEIVYETSNKDYSIVKTTNFNNGAITYQFKNNKTGKIVSPSEKTRKKYLLELISKTEYPQTAIPEDLNNENDFIQLIISESENPKELANVILTMPKYKDVFGTKEWFIANNLGKVSSESFKQFGDRNTITMGIAKSYFAKKGTETNSSNIDVIAYNASSEMKGGEYGTDTITPQDVIDFILTYPNGVDGFLKQPNPDYVQAKDKFLNITGLSSTPKTISEVAGNQTVDIESVEKQRQIAEAEYEKLTSEQENNLAKEYDEWFNSLTLDEKIVELNKSYPYESQISGNDEKDGFQYENQSQLTNQEGQSDTNVANKGGTRSQSTESPEYQQLLKDRGDLESRIKISNEKVARVSKQTNNDFQADQVDLFGERKTDAEAQLFNERADGDAGNKIIAEVVNENKDLKSQLAKVNQKIRDFESGKESWTGDLEFSIKGNEVEKRKSELAEISNFIKSVLSGNKTGRRFFKIPDFINKKAERIIGHSITSHSIRAEEVRHAWNNHGVNGKKNTVNSIPLTKEDIAMIPYIMTSPTRIEKGSTSRDGTESIRYIKEITNGTVIVVEQERKLDVSDMENITMWAETKSHSPNVSDARSKNRPLNSTSQPASVQGSDARTVIISPNDKAKIIKDAENAIEKDINLQKTASSSPIVPLPTFKKFVEKLKKNFARGFGKVETTLDFNEFKRWAKESGLSSLQIDLMVKSIDYRMEHTAPIGSDESGSPLHDLADIYGDDIYDVNAWHYFGDGGSAKVMDKQSAFTIQNVKGNPDAEITIYRAVPNNVNEINSGDWVSINKEYAKKHGENHIGKGFKVLELRVKASQVFTNGDSLHEQGVEFFKTPNGEIYGAKLPNGKIYFNPDRINFETGFHEFGHLWQQLLPTQFSKGVELAKQTSLGKKLFEQLKKEGNYGQDDKKIWAEVTVQMFGQYADNKHRNPKGKMKEFIDWIKDLFAKLGNYMSGKDKNFPKELEPDDKMKIFFNGIMSDMLGNKQIIPEATIDNKEVALYLNKLSDAQLEKLLRNNKLIKDAKCA